MTEIRTCHGKVYPAYLSKIVLQILGQFFADEENTPYITWSLFTSYLFCVSFTMKGRRSEGYRFSFGKMCHCFVGTASLHLHHKVDDASTLACPIVVPQVLSKVHFQAGIAVVTLGRLNTASVQVVGYRYRLDVLQVVIFVVHCCYRWIGIIHIHYSIFHYSLCFLFWEFSPFYLTTLRHSDK